MRRLFESDGNSHLHDLRYASIGMLAVFIFFANGIPDMWHHTSADAAVFGRYDQDFFLLLLAYHVIVIIWGTLLVVLNVSSLNGEIGKIKELYNRFYSKWWLVLAAVGGSWLGWVGFRWLTRATRSMMPNAELGLLVMAGYISLVVAITSFQRFKSHGNSHSSQLKTYCILLVLLIFLSAPIFYMASHGLDWPQHLSFALEIKDTHEAPGFAHVLYHLIVLVFIELLPESAGNISAAIPPIAANVLLGLLIFRLLSKEAADALPVDLLMALSVGLLIISPIFFRLNLPYLLGYINPTIYHNPTQNMLRLFVIPVSLIALRVIDPKPDTSLNAKSFLILQSILLVLLMSLSKPSYTICLLPGLGTYVFLRLFRRLPVDWPLLIWGILLPTFFILTMQLLVTYGIQDDSSIAFGFFEALCAQSIPLTRIFVRLTLSIVFPTAVYLLHFKSAIKDTYLNLSWLVFTYGLIFGYFFYETGPRLAHGNFLWSAYISLFVLMFASVMFIIRHYRPTLHSINLAKLGSFNLLPWRLRFIASIFAIHLLSGVRYYLSYLFM